MLSSTYSTISNLFSHSSTLSKNNKFDNQDLLNIVNSLSCIIDKENINIDIPRLVCVGTQSAGKSETLNRLIGIDLLPTGKDIVTRTPINIQLIKSIDNSHVIFVENNNGTENIYKKITLSTIPTKSEIDLIKETMLNQTNKLAGSSKNISLKEIVIRVYCPNVPNLSLIDLPGLTLVACTDLGQPKDIKDQIRKMVSSYIKESRTIILAIMPARSDLETDMALELSKQCDPKGERTCGILTKVDLLDKNSNITDYILNNISVDLQFKYGYFAIKNRDNQQLSTTTIVDSIVNENDFFDKNDNYKNGHIKDRLGIANLSIYLSGILSKHIEKYIPNIIDEINKIDISVTNELKKLGIHIDDKDEEEKFTYVNTIISNFCNEFIRSLEEKRGLNYGRHIKGKFVNYREEINKIKYEFDKEYLDNAIKNCSGNHMDFSIFSIEILESVLQDKEQNLFNKLLAPSIELTNNIVELINELMDKLIVNSEIIRFPNIITLIKRKIESVILLYKKQIIEKILFNIKIQENYIWTDNKHFLNDLKKMFETVNSEQSKYDIISALINKYMDTVKLFIADQIPKIIMYSMIKKLEDNIYTIIFKNIKNTTNIDTLLIEKNKVKHERQELINKKKIIDQCKRRFY
jgi:hypothetical protein